MSKRSATLGIVRGLALSGMGRASAADWPMWRFDAGRTASTPHSLPAELHQRWVREFPAPQPAWPDEPRLHFDTAYQPVVAGKTMFICLNRTGKLVALDTETGRQKWAFYAGGPMRFAPVVCKDRVLAVSDDGCLYCLDASSGRLRWKARGAAKDHRLLGNGRLISMWPARGGPVLVDGMVYFAAGIWPCEQRAETVTRDGKYLAAVANDSAELMWQAYFHCVHNNPQWMPENTPPVQQRWRMTVYLMKNDSDALLARLAKDFPKAVRLRDKAPAD